MPGSTSELAVSAALRRSLAWPRARVRPLLLARDGLGLWLAFGHGHWGLTLGPVTGRLIADMMTGATPFADPAPYRAERFG